MEKSTAGRMGQRGQQLKELADGVYNRLDRPGFWISYKDAKGKRRRHRTAARTLKEAIEIRALYAAEAERHRLTGTVPVSNISLAEHLKDYKQHQKAHWSASTFARIDSTIKSLVKRLPKYLQDIRRHHVEAFTETRGASPATIERELITLSHALKLAVERGRIAENPATGVKRPKLPRVSPARFIDEPQLLNTLEAAPGWLRAPICLAVFTGMRRSELLRLCWRDVDFIARTVTVRDLRGLPGRIIPLTEHAAQILERLPYSDQSVLPDITEGRLSNAVRRLFSRVGLTGLSLRSLSDTYTAWMAQGGAGTGAIGSNVGVHRKSVAIRFGHISALPSVVPKR